MADSVALTAQERKEHGTRASRRLRKQGLVPAVVYGHKVAAVAVSVKADELGKAIRHGARLIDLTGAASETALIREVQWDPMGQDILHVDFARVSADERITVDVRIELRGTAPGIAAGGVLTQPLHNLSVECLAIRIPDSIRVPVGELQLDQVIHVRDLKFPEGVTPLDDPDAIVVAVGRAADDEGVTAPTAETAEPEIIGRKAEKEEGEEK